MLNYVSIHWMPKFSMPAEQKRRAILLDKHLSWAAKGLGCHLTLTKGRIRFPNKIFDGTLDALQELRREGYIAIKELLESEVIEAKEKETTQDLCL